MNILWVSHLLPFPPVGGVRIRSYNLLKEVAKYNEIYFVGLFQKGQQKNQKEVDEAVHALKKFCKSVTVFPFESWRNKFGWYILIFKSFLSFRAHKENWAKSKKLSMSINRLLEKKDIDLVHFDTISLLQYSKNINRKLPIVINHHNIESDMMVRRAKNEYNPLLKLFCYQEGFKLRKLEHLYCSKALNFVVSELDQERLQRIVLSPKVEIIPNGVNISFMKRQKTDYIEKSLLFVGGLSWYPNIDAVTYFCRDIWPEIVKKEKNAKFYIIGKNPPEKLKNIAKKDKNIILMGFVDDIRPKMSSVSAFVCPMRVGGGTRLKVLDALAMGVPLIATRMACEGIPLINGQHVLFSENPKEFVENILMVFESNALREKLQMNSRQLIKNQFDFVKIGKKMDRCYHDAIKN